MSDKKFRQLINPHSHTHFSLDGASSVEDIVIRNKELGATHVTVTEHGNMNSALELYEKAIKHKMKPIVGIELYVQPPFLEDLRPIILSEVEAKGKTKDKSDLNEKVEKAMRNEYVHLTVHFKDEWAYNYFTALTPKMEERALVKWGERKPIATVDEIAGAAGHITICSSCLIGIVNKFFLPRRGSGVSTPELAEKAYLLMKEIAGKDSFYVEVFPHTVTHNWKKGIKDKETGKTTPGFFEPNECTPFAPNGDLQKPSNEFAISLAKKHGDPIIVSLDSHFATPDQKVVQDARLGNGQENWKFHNSYHICPSHEAYDVLKEQLNISEKEFEEWIDNSYKFASQFDNFKMTTSKDRWVLRPLPENYQDQIIDAINHFQRMDWNNEAMIARLQFEIEVLVSSGKVNLLSYFFTVEDAARFCKENDILMNVRGSAGGSLLLYVIGVSAVNPLKHNLSFERFVTPGRLKANTLPDVDMDISDQGKLFEYLQGKYGDAFCRISVDSQLKLKSSIKDTERSFLGKVRPETERLCVSLIKPPSLSSVSDYDWVFGWKSDEGMQPGLLETHTALKAYAANNPDIWKTIVEMIGIVRQKSQHACGVVITDQPVQNYVPVTIVSGNKVTGFSPKQLESAGLVKFDFLGLNTLKDIQACMKLIKQHKNQDIEWNNLPYSKEVFDAFGRGDTATVFQFDTDTVRPYLRATGPKSIDDLAAITSLCRPGTLDAPSGEYDGTKEMTLAEIYVARAQGRPIQYIHPELEPIMRETLGVQLYQEQTLQIFRDLAGYTYEQAEVVRRGIGKKEEAVLKSCMNDLRVSCKSRGWTDPQVDLLVEQIMASARYSFNKSHAVSYAYVAYACLFLRMYYPVEWWTAILSNSSKDDMKQYWSNAISWIDMPEINNSNEKFYIKENNGNLRIQAPITLLDGVGPATTAEIAIKKPFVDFEDFVQRVDRRIINKRIVFKFILSGLLDGLFPAGVSDLEKISTYLKVKKQIEGGKEEPFPEEFMNLSQLQQLQYKRSIFTVYKLDWTDVASPYLAQKGLVKPYGTLYIYQDPLRKDLNNKPLLNSQMVKRKLDPSDWVEDTFAIVGYIAETEEITYNRKSFNKETSQMESTPNTMMKFLIECGDLGIEAIRWPDWGSNTHGIEKDMSEKLALFVLNRKVHPEKGLQLTVKKVFDISNIDK